MTTPVPVEKVLTQREKRTALFALLGLVIVVGLAISGIIYVVAEAARGAQAAHKAAIQMTEFEESHFSNINPGCIRQVSGLFGGTVNICDAPASTQLAPPAPSVSTPPSGK